MAIRSPRELIDLYWEEVWNKGNIELIREICGSPNMMLQSAVAPDGGDENDEACLGMRCTRSTLSYRSARPSRASARSWICR